MLLKGSCEQSIRYNISSKCGILSPDASPSCVANDVDPVAGAVPKILGCRSSSWDVQETHQCRERSGSEHKTFS
jgi:hypothetical protein